MLLSAASPVQRAQIMRNNSTNETEILRSSRDKRIQMMAEHQEQPSEGVTRRAGAAAVAEEPVSPSFGQKLEGNHLLQQRLRAWQPSLSTRGVFWCYSCIGVIFLAVGAVLLAVNNTAHEITTEYAIASQSVGDLTITIDEDMDAPVYLYYELDNFYQNHRRYVKSREDAQLLGAEIFTDADSLSNCDPAVKNENTGLVYYPCGLVARSVFTDRFTVFNNGAKVSMNTDSSKISWKSDVDHKFQNIDVAKYQDQMDMWIMTQFPIQLCEPKTLNTEKKAVYVKSTASDGGKSEIAACDFQAGTCDFVDNTGSAFVCDEAAGWEKVTPPQFGLESGHFINWMRTAGLPKFRKLYGVIQDVDLRKGDVVTVRIQSDFDVDAFDGKKRVVLATVSALGGQNSFLAVGYLIVGGLCLLFALVFTLRHRLGGAKHIKHLD